MPLQLCSWFYCLIDMAYTWRFGRQTGADLNFLQKRKCCVVESFSAWNISDSMTSIRFSCSWRLSWSFTSESWTPAHQHWASHWGHRGWENEDFQRWLLTCEGGPVPGQTGLQVQNMLVFSGIFHLFGFRAISIILDAETLSEILVFIDMIHKSNLLFHHILKMIYYTETWWLCRPVGKLIVMFEKPV